MVDNIRNKDDKNVVIGGDVRGSRNIIGNGNIVNEAEPRDLLNRIGIDAHRTFIKPIANVKVKHIGIFGGLTLGVILLNALSIFGSISSIYGVTYGTLPKDITLSLQNGIFMATPVSIIALFLWTYFKRSRSLRLGIFGNIEMGSSGRLFLTNVRAKCPFCTGSMTMFPGGQSGFSHILLCERGGSDHRLGFDMTTLPDVETEYREMRGLE